MTNHPPAKWIAVWMVCGIIFLILASCPKARALTPSEREIVTQMKDSITDLRGKYEAQVEANNSALSSLSLAVIQSADLTAAAKFAQEQAATMTAERDQLKDDGILKDTKIAKLNHQYQFAQFIIAGVSAFAVALLVFQFTKSLPMPYNIVAPLGAAGVAYGIITILI